MRTRSHTIAARALAILKFQTPKYWIFREQATDDYGIDAEIELVTQDGELLGDIVKVQIKGHEAIKFRAGWHSEGGIKRTTALYWLRLKMPIFVFSVDVTAERAFWIDAATAIRQRFPNPDNDTCSIRIPEAQEFQKTLESFVKKPLFDYDWRRTYSSVPDLIGRASRWGHANWWYHQADPWMGIEEDEQRFVRHTRAMVQRLAAALGIEVGEWKTDKVWYEEADRLFDTAPSLPYHTAAGMVAEAIPGMKAVIQEYAVRVSETERPFWEAYNPTAVGRADEIMAAAFGPEKSFSEWLATEGDRWPDG